jgi:ribose 1,5-bisphosphokinase
VNRRLIYTLGPSGAGKDSLLAWLASQLPPNAPVHLARRTISRPVQRDGEAHESVDLPSFERLRDQHAFALHWEANGLHYGVRHGELAALQNEGWVLVNGSRAYLAHALRKYPGLTVLHITASAATLRRRLLARGRETPDKVEARVQRAAAFRLPAQVAAIEVGNDGTLEAAGAQLLQALQRLDGWPPASD